MRLSHGANTAALITILCLFGWSGLGQASLLDRQNEVEFLPVDEAFVLQPPEIHGQELRLRWLIAEGYYLYRHRFAFSADAASGGVLGSVELPAGQQKQDEYFGQIEAYYHEVQARIPLTQMPKGDRLDFTVQYQGCADRGLCYPPQSRQLTVELPLASAAAAPMVGVATSQGTVLPAQDRLAALISGSGWAVFLGQFYVLGLLLAFTPCVLPMIPILSGVIVGLDRQRSARFAFLLSLAYVLAMALAYAIFGAIAGLFGANLQAAMQAPAVIISFSALFVVLALSMFGLFKLQLPTALQSRLNEMSAKQQGGTLVGAAVMGFLAALIVGPCVAPPLAGALLYIGQTGDPMRGAAALFSMGIGMGSPLLVLGTAEGGLLPRSGPWMTRVNHLFGFLLLGVAIWLLSRILPALPEMLLWGGLTMGLGAYLGIMARAFRSSWKYPLQLLGLLTLTYGVLILIGGAQGNHDPLRPLQANNTGHPGQPEQAFTRIKSLADLQAALAASQRPVMLDFYADWCVACIVMERKVFPDPAVQALLARMTLLQADVTDNDAIDQALMRELGVIGPPTLIFYSPNGQEHRPSRLVGELDAADFVRHLQAFLNSQ